MAPLRRRFAVTAIVPVKFYLNRYRAVVWLYLAEELRQFAADLSGIFAQVRPSIDVIRTRS